MSDIMNVDRSIRLAAISVDPLSSSLESVVELGPFFAMVERANASKNLSTQNVSVQTANSPARNIFYRCLGYFYNGSSEESKIQSLFNEMLNKGDPANFNAIAESVKSTENWKDTLAKQISHLSREKLQKFIDITPSSLRGYDPEMLNEILNNLYQIADSKDGEKIERLIEAFARKFITTDQTTKLGSGAVNVVYKVTYKDPITDKDVQGVFKPDPAEVDNLTAIREQQFGTAAASGIPFGAEAHLPSRAVASSLVDQELFGEEGRISVKTEFATLNGQSGILMSLAAGKSPKLTDKIKEVINLNQDELEQYIPKLKEGTLTPIDLSAIASILKYRKVEVVSSPEGNSILVGTKVNFENFDPNNAKTFEGLLKLQIKDIITGECDRHPENYFIDTNGKVTGIDEDCCFGVKAFPRGVDVRKQPALWGLIPNNGSLMLRMPPVVTKEIQEQVDALLKNEKELRAKLAPYVTEVEVEATIDRLSRLQEHIHSKDCLIVNSTEDLLSDDALSRIDSNNCYWGREIRAYSNRGNGGGWNYLRAYRDDDGWNYIREHRQI